ncbi:MAG: hypothetical protein ACOX5T_05350 [Candidatus Cryptobacteroides sp.]|jgi:hypothetical protein
MKTKPILFSLLIIVLFYAAWGLSQFIGIKMRMTLLSSALFSLVFTGIIGCFVPIYLKNRLDWKYCRPGSKKILGYLFLISTIVFSTIFSGALLKTIELNYSWNVLLKYILLFFPMSLGIGLFAFLLIPNTIQGWESNKIKSTLLIISISIFFFLAFYIDSLFQDIALAATMGFIGLLLGLGYFFLRNFWIAYASLFIIMLVNTLADNKYDDYNYGIVVVGAFLSLAILSYDFIKNIKRMNHE